MGAVTDIFEIIGIKTRLFSMSNEEIRKTKAKVRAKIATWERKYKQAKGKEAKREAKEMLNEWRSLYQLMRRVRV